MISKDNQMDIYKVWYMQLNEIGMKAIPEKTHIEVFMAHTVAIHIQYLCTVEAYG
jgi:hypothetical protein